MNAAPRRTLLDLQVSLRHVIALGVFLVIHAIATVGYLHANFAAVADRLTRLETTCVDESRARAIAAESTPSIDRLITTNSGKIDRLDDRLRSVEQAVASRNVRLDRVLSAIENQAGPVK